MPRLLAWIRAHPWLTTILALLILTIVGMVLFGAGEEYPGGA